MQSDKFVMAQSPTQDMDETSEQPVLSRSNTSNSGAEKVRSRSRGSTTSLQSVGVGGAFQPAQQEEDSNMPINHHGFYVPHGPGGPQPMYHSPEDMLLQYQHSMAHLQQQPHHPQSTMEHSTGMSLAHDMRPMSQHAFQDMHHFPMQYPNGMPQYPISQQHMHHIRHQSEQYEGSPAPEDSNNENGGAKRRKGTASSMANDQELRRLLSAYQGKSLKEIAAEVQKNEGSGGKSEKAKQVFAMLWLQESCQRSNNSVRRDRVFARYTERCGNERVPTLNPASFGKLVRIIFPNVQTRRLGVRGESKYHYVDLSLIPEDDDRPYSASFERPSTALGIKHERQNSVADTSKLFQSQKSTNSDHSAVRTATEAADFPAPRTALLSINRGGAEVTEGDDQEIPTPRLDCEHINTPIIRLPIKNMQNNLVAGLPSVRPNLPGTISTYLAMPTIDSLSQPAPSAQDTPIELPDIYTYLTGTTYDASIAKALFHLYRSYCIDVIDAFRKCKEKPFFNHHSAFNGKMTVPVSKLFSMECLAPWIQECDLRMYKQIVRFIAPLTLQNVPDMVWGVFDRISSKLVSHLIMAFEEKCPVHVVVAKTIPAARFASLLKKLRGANAATLQVSRLLEDPQQRTQMWLDLMAMVDPDRLIDDSVPPPEALVYVQGMLKSDVRNLISPMSDALVNVAEQDPTSPYATYLIDIMNDLPGVLPTDINAQPLGLLEKWIGWLERLPQAFENHHPQCMVDWHTRLFRSLMLQIGQGGAHSYQSWWFVESFTTQMLSWMTQMEGLLMPESRQQLADETEQTKKTQYLKSLGSSRQVLKRKRDEDTVEDEQQPARDFQTGPNKGEILVSSEQPPQSTTLTMDTANETVDEEETDAELDELRRGGPLDLPSIHTGLSSPVKRQTGVNDDSGIDLGLDIDIEAEKEAKKFNKRDWLLSSDPVDGTIGLGVVV